ncbi:hypothetical protein AKO1_008916, partial [Acrasis kona]
NDLTIVKLINNQNGDYCDVIADVAIVNKLWLQDKNGKSHNVLSSRSMTDIAKNKDATGAVMFPWTGPFKNDVYVKPNSNPTQQVSVPNNSSFGLMLMDSVRPGYWLQQVYSNEEGAHCQIQFDINNIEGYPYSATIIIKYHLSSSGLKVQQSIRNAINVPFAFGWNPEFIFKNSNISSGTITIPTLQAVDLDQSGFPTYDQDYDVSEVIPIVDNSFSLANSSLDLNFYLNCTSLNLTSTRLENLEMNYTIVVDQEPSYRYIRLMRTENGVSIQPLTALSDSFNNPLYSGLNVMNTDDPWYTSFTISLE